MSTAAHTASESSISGFAGAAWERLGDPACQEGEEVPVSGEVDADFGGYAVVLWPRLVRAGVLLGCSRQDAEDLAQSTLERCLSKWSTVRRADDRDAYVHRILVNTFIDSRRRFWHRERPTEHVPDRPTPDVTEALVIQNALDRALANLSADQRLAVVLRYYLRLSEEQMATVLNVAPGTVKSRLSRALRAMSADPELADREGDP